MRISDWSSDVCSSDLDDGRVEFLGEDISLLAPHKRFARGLVRTFQIPHEFHRLTVLENLMVAADGQDGERRWENWLDWGKVRRSEDEVRQRAMDNLAFLGLTPIARERAGNPPGATGKRACRERVRHTVEIQ